MFKQACYRMKISSFRRMAANARGGVLIGAVVAMVIMGALGGGMVSMLGSSYFHEVRDNFGVRAYYQAESGFRYAVSTYISGGGGNAGKESLLNLHDQTVLPGVELDVVLTTHTAATEDNNLAESFTITGGWVVNPETGASEPIEPGGELGTGGNLLVTVSEGKVLPQYRGLIRVGGQQVRYQRLSGGANGNFSLHGLAFPDPNDQLSYDQITNTEAELVFPVETADITSTGTFPAGGLSSLLSVRRSIDYHWPLSGVFSDPLNPPESDQQDFFNLPGLNPPTSLVNDDRFDVTPGDFQQEARVDRNVDGEPGVRVKLQQTDRVYVNINWWEIDGFDVNSAYQTQDKTLTYDLQIKTQWGDHPNFSRFLVGVSTRVESNNMFSNTFYGMSLFHVKSNASNKDKDIPDWFKTSDSLKALASQHPDLTHLIFWKSTNGVIALLESKQMAAIDEVDWATIVLRIEETGSGTDKVNKVMAIIYDQYENPRGTLNWPPMVSDTNAAEFYQKRGWNDPDLSAIYDAGQEQEPKLSTGTLTTIPKTRPEIGFHVFSDFGAQNEVFLDDFGVRMFGAGGEGGGTPYVQPIQQN